MKSDARNKDIFYIIVLILTLISMIIATVCYYYLVASQTEEGTTIDTGSLVISYVDGYQISNVYFEPIEEPNLTATEFIIKKNFSVVSSGTLDQEISIYFVSEGNTFSDNALKYSIYNSDNGKMVTGSIHNNGETELINKVYLASGESANYTVLIWLGETHENQESEKNKYVTGRFKVQADQIKH